MTNEKYLKQLDGLDTKYYDVKSAVEDITPGSFAKLNYTSRVLAENLLRKCPSEDLKDSLIQLIEKRTDKDFPWYPSRVICHDILGLTAFVDLAGLREAVASKGVDPQKINPVVPTQLIVDHSLAVECGGFDPDAFQKNRDIEDRRNADRFDFINWTKKAFDNVDVIPPGNGIMHQINLEKMSPVIHNIDGIASPDTLVGTDSHTPHVDALGVIAVGVGGLEAENVMLGNPSYMRVPEIIGVEITGTRGAGITATDIALSLTSFLRDNNVISAYLEFYGSGIKYLDLGDNASNTYKMVEAFNSFADKCFGGFRGIADGYTINGDPFWYLGGRGVDFYGINRNNETASLVQFLYDNVSDYPLLKFNFMDIDMQPKNTFGI
jgi:aconitate hydratase